MKGNCVYSLDGWAESGESSVGIQEKESLAQVWHKRLGYISEAGLHELEKREVFRNKGLGKLEFYKNCVLEKSTRGPSRVESISSCRYFLSIVDNYSRRVWVHFLRHKNEAFSKFKEWKQLVENHTGKVFTNLVWFAIFVLGGSNDDGINRSPSTTLEKKTPIDLWSGHLANYEMLRIFGYIAYSHVNQGKLRPRAIKCIFLGDVVFNESLMYKDTLKGASATDSGKEVEFEFRRRPTAKGVGLCMADSHIGKHPKDNFTPLETIRRLCSVFERRSHLSFEGETSKPNGRLVSLDSSEDSVGTPAGRFILLGIIPTTIPDTTPSMTSPTTHIDTTPIPIVSPTIPPSPNYTPALPDYSSASDMKFDPSEDPSSDYIPPLPATLPFLSSTDDSSDNDIPDTPPSPTHGTPFTKTTISTQRSPIASGGLRHRVMILSPGQPIPHGRPYRYHPNGPVHMMTIRKRVRPLPTYHLAVRHSVNYSSSDHFSLNDSSSSSSSSSSSETSSDSPVDALSDSVSSRSSYDHSLPTSPSGTRSSHRLCSLVPSVHRSSTTISERPSHDSSFVSPSRKRSRSPVASIPLSSPILEALSSAHVDLLPSPKTIRSPESATDLEGCSKDSFKPYVPRKARLRLRLERGLIEVRVDKVTNPVIGDDTPESAQEGVIKVTYETLGDLVQRFHDHTKEIPVHRVQAIESVQMDQGYRIVATGQMDQRVTRSQRRELRVQRELRQIRRFIFYVRMRIARLEACARRHLGYHS
ncbi:putative reverse transcriptase domain-containing protein [Tanacetum coccineum]